MVVPHPFIKKVRPTAKVKKNALYIKPNPQIFQTAGILIPLSKPPVSPKLEITLSNQHEKGGIVTREIIAMRHRELIQSYGSPHDRLKDRHPLARTGTKPYA